MTDYDTLKKLYRRAYGSTGRKPYAFFASRRLHGETEARLDEEAGRLRGEAQIGEPQRLFGIPIFIVRLKYETEPRVVARVEVSNQSKASQPTNFEADWSALDYVFEARLEETTP